MRKTLLFTILTVASSWCLSAQTAVTIGESKRAAVNVNANMTEVDVRELCAGVYVLRVETDSGAVVKRVVKQ